jgi:predicted ABC-type ATPase
VPAEPRAVIIAGPNGSGKTTLTKRLRPLALPELSFPQSYINADDIAADLRTSGDPDAEYAAFLEGRRLRQVYREDHRSFAYETVLSHPSGILDMMRLRDAGYRVTLIIVTTRHPSLNVERVRRRVLLGGHDVPTDRILSRHKRCTELLPRAIETAHEAWVFDSTDRISLVMACRDGGVVGQESGDSYVMATLAERLRERRSELEAIGLHTRAEERAGTYQGVIRWVGRHFLVQECAGAGLVLHDRSMAIGDVGVGVRAQIAYREGAGTVNLL